MDQSFLVEEPALRLGFFFLVFLILAVWEIHRPRRPQHYRRWQRWPANLGLVAVDAAIVRLFFPFAAVGTAAVAEARGWGILNALPISMPVKAVIALLLLDLAIYLQHRLFHSAPWLWRLHRMHHADLEFDVTTGVRFHPLEVLLSIGLKAIVILCLGAPALAALVFEIWLNATSMFSHANM